MPAQAGFRDGGRGCFRRERDGAVAIACHGDARDRREQGSAPRVDDAHRGALLAQHHRHVPDRPHHGIRDLRQRRLEVRAQIAIEGAVVGVIDAAEGRMRAEPVIVNVDECFVMRLREADQEAAQHVAMQPHVAGGLALETVGAELDHRRRRRHEDADRIAAVVDRGEQIAQRLDVLRRIEMIGLQPVPDRCRDAQRDGSFSSPRPRLEFAEEAAQEFGEIIALRRRLGPVDPARPDSGNKSRYSPGSLPGLPIARHGHCRTALRFCRPGPWRC